MSNLSKFVPDSGGDGVTRQSLVTIADFISWIHVNKPDVFKAALRANGDKEVKKALNELEEYCDLWR